MASDQDRRKKKNRINWARKPGAKMKLHENDERVYEVVSIESAKKMVGGFDLAMATVDCDPQHYRLYDDDGKLVWEREGPRFRWGA